MLPVVITAERRRWLGNEKKTWRRALPTSWNEVAGSRRRVFFGYWIRDEAHAALRILRHVLRLPGWAWRALGADELAALCAQLEWMRPGPECAVLPFDSFRHRGVTYYLPTPKGQNLVCIEYPLADKFYERAVLHQDERALLCLVGTLCREANPDQAEALKRNDRRVPLHSSSEAEARADRLRGLPAETAWAVLYFFAGLKEYVAKVYGPWIFEQDDDDPDDDVEETAPAEKQPSGPNFGWWGTFQQVAEGGVFGPLRDVYQSFFHEVCIYLVRQKQREDAMRQASPAGNAAANSEEEEE
jgi:hypothetical protein